MKINKMYYYDHELEWCLEPIQFSELNLLVGVSGVGKTQILKSILNLRKIVRGASLNGVEWEVEFTTKEHSYRWSGAFDTKQIEEFIPEEESDVPGSRAKKFKINKELLYKEDELVIERNDNEIKFRGNNLPKLSSFKSAIELLGEEEDIIPVKDGFNKIIYSDDRINAISIDEMFSSFSNKSSLMKYSTLESIQEGKLSSQTKLALVYKHKLPIFEEIKQHFINIFEQVEDIKIEPDENDDDLPSILAEYPIVKIKEKGVNKWIEQGRISSGMLRTLMHISELYLSADGTIILIDEFENSLGVNCIDILGDLLCESRRLQFIITSHHPYIINNIDMRHWKIITRKGGVVSAKNAEDLGLGKSKHEAFMQLINLEEFEEGIFTE
ncbi:MAG TPA: AAA family ATPase [Nostocaceae cyanobacterium]|nr:AAA family ATPase [Nostocaceae cyanobacterium]